MPQPEYPPFAVPGVKPEDIWQLYNVSNFTYYCQKVETLTADVCPFCVIDPAVNTVLYRNESWMLWKNVMAPRTGQQLQLVIPSVRHIQCMTELTINEMMDFHYVVSWAKRELGVGDHGAWLARSGDAIYNAKSVPHFHYNFHLPTGEDRVELTIAKSTEDLVKKHGLLVIWEKMRVAREEGVIDFKELLPPEEWALVASKM